MSVSRGRAADYAKGRNRSWTWPGVVPANVSPPVSYFGGAVLTRPRVVFALGIGFQSFVWAGNVPAPEKPELYRSVLTQQQLPGQTRSFTWAGNQPANVTGQFSPGPPTDVFAVGRQYESAYLSQASRSFTRPGNQPTNVAPQVPLFGTSLLARPMDVNGVIQASHFWAGANVTVNTIPGSIAGVFYWQDETERRLRNDSFTWRGVPTEEQNLKPQEIGFLLSQGQVGDYSQFYRSFTSTGVQPQPVFPEVYRSVITVQQQPLDIQRNTFWSGVQPADVILETPIATRLLFTLQQLPQDLGQSSFTDRAHPDEGPPPPPPPPPPPAGGHGHGWRWDDYIDRPYLDTFDDILKILEEEEKVAKEAEQAREEQRTEEAKELQAEADKLADLAVRVTEEVHANLVARDLPAPESPDKLSVKAIDFLPFVEELLQRVEENRTKLLDEDDTDIADLVKLLTLWKKNN